MHSGGIEWLVPFLRTMSVFPAYVGPLVCNAREWDFDRGCIDWFVGWSEVEVDFLFFLGFFLGWIKVYIKPSHSQMWSSGVAKATATRITYIHTYIHTSKLIFPTSYNLKKSDLKWRQESKLKIYFWVGSYLKELNQIEFLYITPHSNQNLLLWSLIFNFLSWLHFWSDFVEL